MIKKVVVAIASVVVTTGVLALVALNIGLPHLKESHEFHDDGEDDNTTTHLSWFSFLEPTSAKEKVYPAIERSIKLD